MRLSNNNQKTTRSIDPSVSQVLHARGFASLADATECSNAVMKDLEEGRIDATEANRINNAIGQWRRAHVRKGGR